MVVGVRGTKRVRPKYARFSGVVVLLEDTPRLVSVFGGGFVRNAQETGKRYFFMVVGVPVISF